MGLLTIKMYSLLRKYKKYIFFLVPTLRIPSVGWLSLLIELRRQFRRLEPGVVLDIGGREAPYKKFIPYTKYLILDIDKSSSPDILGDAHNIQWESNYFDTVLAIETLEHVRDPQRVIDEIYRVLKKRGVCILSTRFLYPYHPGPEDHYRFTWDSLKNLFRKFGNIEIYHHGNRLQLFVQFINFRMQETVLQAIVTGFIAAVLNIFNPLFALTHFKRTKFPLGFVVYAKK